MNEYRLIKFLGYEIQRIPGHETYFGTTAWDVFYYNSTEVIERFDRLKDAKAFIEKRVAAEEQCELSQSFGRD